MLAEIRQREGVIVIRPTGRMIGAANAEIREQINEELEEHFDSPKVIFNLENVTRMDSSGLGTLVSVNVTVSRKGGRTGARQRRRAHPQPSHPRSLNEPFLRITIVKKRESSP